MEKFGGSYLKEAWGTIPEACIATLVATIGTIGTLYVYFKDQRTSYRSFQPYKNYYCVVRPDDPRVGRILPGYHERNEDINDFKSFVPPERPRPF